MLADYLACPAGDHAQCGSWLTSVSVLTLTPFDPGFRATLHALAALFPALDVCLLLNGRRMMVAWAEAEGKLGAVVAACDDARQVKNAARFESEPFRCCCCCCFCFFFFYRTVAARPAAVTAVCECLLQSFWGVVLPHRHTTSMVWFSVMCFFFFGVFFLPSPDERIGVYTYRSHGTVTYQLRNPV